MKSKLSQLVRTSDNWYPCIDTDKVSVTLHYGKENGISVWGDDDFGMELSLPNYTRTDALFLYRSIVKKPVLTIAWLKEKGFKNA